jgi:hypothetical protein
MKIDHLEVIPGGMRPRFRKNIRDEGALLTNPSFDTVSLAPICCQP